MDFPDAPERVARLEEAVAVIRALWTGGPVTRPSPFYPLDDAVAFPIPDPAPPRSSSAARRRPGPGWRPGSATAGTPSTTTSRRNLPRYLEALEAAGRRREDQQVIVGFQGDWLGDADFRDTDWFHDPRGTWERWHDIGADGAIVLARTTTDVDALVEAVGRW